MFKITSCNQGLDLDERERNPFSSTDGFYPLLATIMDFPFPTICLITGHVFGGACLLTLARKLSFNDLQKFAELKRNRRLQGNEQ